MKKANIRLRVSDTRGSKKLRDAIFYGVSAALVERGFTVPDQEPELLEGWAEIFLKRKGGEAWFSEHLGAGRVPESPDYEVVIQLESVVDAVRMSNGSDLAGLVSGLRKNDTELVPIGKSKLNYLVKTVEGLHLDHDETAWGKPYRLGTPWPGYLRDVVQVASQIVRIVEEHRAGRIAAVRAA